MITQAEVNAYRTAYLAKARDIGLDQRGSVALPRDQFSECIAAGLAAAWTARTDNVKRDNMSDQPNEGRDQRAYDYAARTISPEFAAALAPNHKPLVRTLLLEDGVDSDLDLQVKILDSGIDGASPMLALSRPGEDTPNVTISQRLLLRVAEAVTPVPVATFGHHDHTERTGSAMIYDRDGRLDLKWVDRAAHVTVTPEVIEGFVEQVNQLRGEVAEGRARFRRLATEAQEAIGERDRLTAWSDEIAHRVPESYEGGEGTQEACINSWVIDLMKVAVPFAATLRAVPVDRAIRLRAILATLPADPVDVEHLYDAAARLGGE